MAKHTGVFEAIGHMEPRAGWRAHLALEVGCSSHMAPGPRVLQTCTLCLTMSCSLKPDAVLLSV